MNPEMSDAHMHLSANYCSQESSVQLRKIHYKAHMEKIMNLRAPALQTLITEHTSTLQLAQMTVNIDVSWGC